MQRVIAINTYIFSTIYYFDQHHPISNESLQQFITFTQQEILKFLPHPIAQNRIRWYEPHSTGGLGMKDLSKQLQGRRGFYIQYMIQQQVHIHPLQMMLREYSQAVVNTLLRNLNVKKYIVHQSTISTLHNINEIIPIINCPGLFINGQITTQPYHTFYFFHNNNLNIYPYKSSPTISII